MAMSVCMEPVLFKPYNRRASETFVENFKYAGCTLMSNFEDFMPVKKTKWNPESINIKVRNMIKWDVVGDDHRYTMMVGRRKFKLDNDCIDSEVCYYCAKKGIVRRVLHSDITYSCRGCKTDNPTHFIDDVASGDIVCIQCGVVVTKSKMNDSDHVRHFEDDKNTKHYGMAFNPIMSMATNLRTEIVGATGFKLTMHRRISNRDIRFGGGGFTHQAYRDNMILRAMDRLSLLSHLSSIVIQKGLANFARVRNYHEHVHKFDMTLVCCVAVALYDVYLDQKKLEDTIIETRKAWPCLACDLKFATRKDVDRHSANCSAIPLRKRKEYQQRKLDHDIRANQSWELTVKKCDYIEFEPAKRKRI